LLTTNGLSEPELPLKLVSPTKVTLMMCVGLAGRAPVDTVAWPLPLSVELPMRLAGMAGPSKKFTVPLGVPAPGVTGETVAVNVALWPSAVEVGAPVTATVVLDFTTFTSRSDVVALPV
jgi:hypothetical protein